MNKTKSPSDKKTLKDNYKNHKPLMGVYQLINRKNNLRLIESSKDVHASWNRHKTELKLGSHRNKQLQKDWNIDKEQSFSFELISELEHSEKENVNYNDELKILIELIKVDLSIPHELTY